MSLWIDLDTLHGPVRAWRADPSGPSRGAVLLIQEIFGVNAHIRSVAERFTAAGFVALAPAMFDLVERDVELAYDKPDFERGRALVTALGFDRAMDVLAAAMNLLHTEGLRVGAVGFCWGGSLSFLCNTRLGLPAVGYYGARSVPFLDEPARAPLMFHFGERDASIPPTDVELHRQKQPRAQVFVYPNAGHAFNRDVDIHAFEPASAALAWQRTLDFLAENLR
ncbi:dienelactone hydrolase family protein [Lysobacter sp. CFH 32150]|uniref:dienelactone hydrolase family protein n=1 Tax=Lysobacter sp. CFH 32150 TaxID=2927128 RepID=UPI001FA7E563|nr:dienelactone hydrolase family protein [Lysobacter sp. CFH 32150]MCI4567280.1 dienelactone hydrolase family protein [Lysobacter sp. CFH 32150]